MLSVLQYLISIPCKSDMVNHTMSNNGLQNSQAPSSTTDNSVTICLIEKMENDSALQGDVSESLKVPQNQEHSLSHRWVMLKNHEDQSIFTHII